MIISERANKDLWWSCLQKLEWLDKGLTHEEKGLQKSAGYRMRAYAIAKNWRKETKNGTDNKGCGKVNGWGEDEGRTRVALFDSSRIHTVVHHHLKVRAQRWRYPKRRTVGWWWQRAEKREFVPVLEALLYANDGTAVLARGQEKAVSRQTHCTRPFNDLRSFLSVGHIAPLVPPLPTETNTERAAAQSSFQIATRLLNPYVLSFFSFSLSL